MGVFIVGQKQSKNDDIGHHRANKKASSKKALTTWRFFEGCKSL